MKDSISGGRFGLMIPRLRHLEKLLEIPGMIKVDTAYNQPGIGATFAAAVDLDGIIRAIVNDEIKA